MTTAPLRSLVWGPHSRLCFWVAAATFLVDQAHKTWMLHGYGIRERGRVHVTPFLDYVFVLNEGVSYGIPIGSRWLLTGFAVATCVGLWIWVARAATGRLMAASLALIIGGALGNALDRVLYKGVVDYFSLHAFGYYWYVFNIADVAIVAGVAGMVWESFFAGRPAPPP